MMTKVSSNRMKILILSIFFVIYVELGGCAIESSDSSSEDSDERKQIKTLMGGPGIQPIPVNILKEGPSTRSEKPGVQPIPKSLKNGIKTSSEKTSNVLENGTFCYFAYGRRMLFSIMQKTFPNAKRITNGKLKDARLDFGHYDREYRGSRVTACKHCGWEVYGMLYSLKDSDMQKLEKEPDIKNGKKEIVREKIYTRDLGTVECVFVRDVDCPAPLFYGHPLPSDRQPSKTYQEELVKGASNANLPDDYVAGLSRIPNNGQTYESEF